MISPRCAWRDTAGRAGVFDALRAIGYDTFVSLELSNFQEPHRWAAEARRYLAQWV